MKFLSLILAACLATACTSVTHVSPALAAEHPEARPFDADSQAKSDVETALAEAENTGKYALIAMGANWCHDSRALAGWFETDRFQSLLKDNYVVRYVDVGQKDRNLDIAQQFGLPTIVGTPTVIIVDDKGTVLNLDTAPSWRNAASREEDAIFDYFVEFAPSSVTNE